MKKWLVLVVVLVITLMLCPFGALAQEAQRIVSLTPSGTEILFALGAGEQLVGISNYCNYPEGELDGIPRCGDYAEPNLEMIVSLEPDVVIAGNYLQQDTIDALERLGIATIAAEADTYDGIYDSIKLIASVAKVDAAGLLDEMERKEGRILEAVQGLEPKSCYFAVSFYDWGDYSAGPGSFPYDIMRKIGLKPITEGMAYAWPIYTLEALIEADPQVVFLSCDAERAAVFFSAPGYKDLTATKAGRVYVCDPDAAARPTPRILDVMARMAEDAYGIAIE